LKLIETLYINGTPNPYGLSTLFTVGMTDYTSAHDIYNETIFGTNTMAQSIYWTGDYYKNGTLNLNFDASLGYSVSLAKIINFGISLDYEPTQRGVTNEFTCDPYTRVAGLNMENTDKIYLNSKNQYLAVNANICKLPDDAPNDEDSFTGSTTMKTLWKFDVYHDLNLEEYVTDAETSISYDVTN
jgi:hypothetical protein